MAVKGFDNRNIEGMYLGAYQERFEQSWANTVAIYNPNSDRGTEEYGIFGSTPGMREWVGERKLLDTNVAQYEIRNRKYEATLPIKKEHRDRDKTGILELQISNFADIAASNHWEDLIVALIIANGTCYDGQAFFSASHLWGDSGTQSNLVTASDIPALNVAAPTAPTPEEFANSLLRVIGWMLLFKNDQGKATINGRAKMFTVVVSTVELFAAASVAIGGDNLSNDVPNPLAGLVKAGMKFDLKLIPDITGATAKFRVFRTDGIYKPFILQNEEDLQPQVLGEDSDHFFKFDEYLLGVKGRRGAGYGLWEHAVDATFS